MEAILDAMIEQTVGMIAKRFLVKEEPVPNSDTLVKDMMENLQPRPSTPDINLEEHGLKSFDPSKGLDWQ